MTSGTSQETEHTAEAVLVLLASVNRSMLDIRKILLAKSAAIRVTHTCDVRRFPHDGGTPDYPEWFSFAVYVNVETKIDDGFWWAFELSLEAGQWTLGRHVERPGEYGSESIIDFESIIYASFAELQNGYAPLMAEFVRSAEAFSFPS